MPYLLQGEVLLCHLWSNPLLTISGAMEFQQLELKGLETKNGMSPFRFFGELGLSGFRLVLYLHCLIRISMDGRHHPLSTDICHRKILWTTVTKHACPKKSKGLYCSLLQLAGTWYRVITNWFMWINYTTTVRPNGGVNSKMYKNISHKNTKRTIV